MRLLSLLLIAGGLAACAASPPRSNPWADKAMAFEPAAKPVPLPQWPESTICGPSVCLTPQAANALLLYADVADQNYTIGVELAGAVDELGVAYNSLVKAGAAEHELAELRGDLVDAERKARVWDKLGYWSLLALLGAAGIAR